MIFGVDNGDKVGTLMLFVDDTNWGIGVYTPVATNFIDGIAGALSYESTYIALIKRWS